MVYRTTLPLILAALLGLRMPSAAADGLVAATGFLDDGLYELARMELESIRGSNADNQVQAEALFLLAECARRSSRTAAALELFDAYGEQVPGGPRAAESALRGAVAAQALGDQSGAERRFAEVIDRHQGSSWVTESRARRGRIFRDSGRLAEARADFGAAGRGTGPYAAYARYDLGLMQAQAAEFGASVESFGAVLDLNPDAGLAAHARTELARALHRQGSHEAALLALESGAGGPGVDRITGEVLLALDRPQEALAPLERAVEIEGSISEAAYSLAWCRLATGDWEAAEEEFAALAAGSDDWQVPAGMAAAEAAIRGGAPAKARRHLDKVITVASEPDTRARALIQRSVLDPDSAGDRLAEAVSLDVVNPEVSHAAWMAYGRHLYEDSRPVEAAAAYGRAIEVATRSGFDLETARYGRMVALLASGDYTEAADLASGVDDATRVLLVEAEAFIASGRLDAARQDYRILLDRPDLDPVSEQEALFGLGWCELRGEEPSRSLDIFDRLASRHGDSDRGVEALMRMGDAFSLMSRDDAAWEFYGLYLQHEPRGRLAAAAHQGRAESLLRMGEVSEAIKAARAARMSGAGSPDSEAQAFLIEAEARFAEERFAAAESLYVQAAARAVDPGVVERALYRVGDSRFNREDPTAAVRAYSLVLRRFPDGELAPRAVDGLLWAAAESGGRVDGRSELARLRRQVGSRGAEIALHEALVLLDRGATSEAEIALSETAQDYHDTDVALEARFALARIRVRSGDADSAAVLWLQLMEGAPKHQRGIESRSLLAQRALDAGDPGRVIDLVGFGKAATGRDSLVLGLAYVDIGNVDAARALLEWSRDRSDMDAEAHWRAVVSLAKLDLASGGPGLEGLESAVAEAPPGLGAEAQYEIARHHYRLGATDSALKGFLRIRYLFPGEWDWLRRAEVGAAATYEYAGRADDARALYEEIIAADSTDVVARSARRRLEELAP